MRLRRYRTVAVLLLALHVNACTTWRPTTVSPPQLLEDEAPSRVRITRLAGEQVTIEAPRIRADSVVGRGTAAPVSVAVSDIQQIEVRRTSVLRTLGLAPGVLFFIAAVLCSGGNCKPNSGLGLRGR